MDRRTFLTATGAVLAGSTAGSIFGNESAGHATAQAIDIELGKVTGPLPHFWEMCAGSDRTAVGLRDQWRQDLVRAHRDFGMQSVRCHGLFDDEMGIAAQGAGDYNFLYVDQIYDFMIEHGVRPFVELSFMPEAFASSGNRIFSYKGNTSPPRNWQDWYDMVQAFTRHCVQRYGIGEVVGWRFEVWNEPNIDFWTGTQEQYFELYRKSVLAIKSVDKRLQVGGPATAQLDWIPDLIRYCAGKDLPLDFVSSHIYPLDPQGHIFTGDKMYTYEEVIPRGVAQVKHQVESSAMPHLPIWITEWSSSNLAFIAHTIKECIGLADAMAYWTFSNVFEEQGVPRGIFNSSYGMIGQWGIPRPALHAFALMHKLGETQLRTSEGPVLATRRADGSVAVLVWNLIPEENVRFFANGNPAAANAGAEHSVGSELALRLKIAGASGQTGEGQAGEQRNRYGDPGMEGNGQSRVSKARPDQATACCGRVATTGIAAPPA